jgi:transcriptional regulator with XRE-family HTH domain
VHEDSPGEFARLLREVKRAAGLSDQGVADAAAVDRSQAWRWANAGASPGYEPLRRLAEWIIDRHPDLAPLALQLLPAAGYETPPDDPRWFPLAPEPAAVAAGDVPDVRAHLYAALAAVNAPLREAVLAEARAGVPFTDPVERIFWETAEWSAEERAEAIADLRVRRAQLGAGPSASETG